MRRGTRGIVAACILCSFALILSGCGSDSSDEITYVALGASDATGIGASPPSDGYVFLLEDRLQNECRSTELLNLGVPGVDLGAVANAQLPAAIESDPDLVTLWPGPNDLIGGEPIDDFEAELDEIVSTILEESRAALALATIPDLTSIPRFEEDPSPDVTLARIAAFNEVIVNETAGSDRVLLVDLREVALTDDLVNDADGFHPNDAGYEVIADQFFPVVRPRVCESDPGRILRTDFDA